MLCIVNNGAVTYPPDNVQMYRVPELPFSAIFFCVWGRDYFTEDNTFHDFEYI